MTKLLDLKSSGALKYLFDGRKGSILDVSGSNLGAAAIAGTPTWARTKRGFGVRTPAAGLNYLGLGNPASLQLSTATIFAVASRSEGNPADFQSIMYKLNAYYMLFANGAEPKAFGTWDSGGGAWRASTFSELPNGKVHLYAISFVSGAVNGTAFYVDGVPCGLATTTIVNQLSEFRLGWGAGIGNIGLGGPLLLAGVANRVLRPDEHLELYTDWLKEGYVLDVQHRNGVKHFIPAKTDADYVREGIFLDTDFVRQPGGTIRDLSPSGYAGTVTGIVVPGKEGEGATFPTQAPRVDWGNVTQLNSVAQFSIEQWFDIPAGTIPSSRTAMKYADVNNYFQFGPAEAVAATKRILLDVATGGVLGAVGTTAACMRNGTRQHMIGTFNAGIGKIYVDGNDEPITVAVALPAVTANLAAASLMTGHTGGFSMPGTYNGQRLYTGALTPGQARAAYLKNFAQKLIWQAPGEDCPVSLVASYGVATPNALGGGWRIIDGAWKRSEDSQGRRWIECVVAGTVAIPQPNSFGTWVFTTSKIDVASFYIMFAAATPTAYLDASQNGYMMALDSAELLYGAATIVAGAFFAFLAYTAGNYCPTGSSYTFCINRRPSDGRFTIYVKGGPFKVWTLVSTVGGGGSNPTAADTTITTSKWFTMYSSLGSKILDYDPNVPGSHPRMYAGVLDPTRNEVP